jgi:uncharacterized membrane protein (DUF106 family)
MVISTIIESYSFNHYMQLTNIYDVHHSLLFWFIATCTVTLNNPFFKPFPLFVFWYFITSHNLFL